MREYVAWLYSCIILHNFLATLGDQWLDLDSEDQNQLPSGSLDPDVAGSIEDFQDEVKEACVVYNYEQGVLPMKFFLSLTQI
jgi:hypothetical protein